MAALEQRRSPAATSGEEPAPAAAPERPAPARWSVRVSAWVAAAAGALALWGATARQVVKRPTLPGGASCSPAGAACAAAAGRGRAAPLCLPELVGPLAAGALLRSLGVVQLDPTYQHAAAVVRKAALAVILIRAGLGLDGAALRRLLALVLRLAVVPSAVEAATLAAIAHLLLGLPWLAMMAAVSPAVVIPALFRLQAKGYGTEKGIPTLVVAAASLDDVIAVTAFGIMYGIVFADGELSATFRGGGGTRKPFPSA
ncbi:Sodium/hydrogen exchanger 9B2, partial [Gryllus bimaculatus]